MKTWSTKAMALGMGTIGVSAMAALSLSGCEAVLGKILPPGVEYKDAVLVDHPSAREMARWGCFETLGDFACEAAGLNKKTVWCPFV